MLARPSPSDADPVAKSPLTYLFFYDAIYPETLGGVEHRNYQLACSLGISGHRVVLAGWAGAPASLPIGVEVRTIGAFRSLYGRSGRRSRLQALRLAWNAARIDLTGVDVVETSNIPFLHLFPLSVRCRRAGIPLIVTWHEFWGDYWRDYMPTGRLRPGLWRLYRWIERRAASRGDRAVAVSHLTAQRVGSVRGEEIEVIPNGVRFEELRALAGRNRNHDPKIGPLVFAGRLISEKRGDLLVEAVAILGRSMPGRILTIIGDGPARASLQSQVERLGLTDRIELLGRLETSTEVWDRMSRAKIAVLPSAREGFGLFALEAMALGLPVIHCASPESAVREVVRDRTDGRQVDPDPELLAAAIHQLLGDPVTYSSMSASAVERASEFDWSAATQTLEGVSRELLEGS